MIHSHRRSERLLQVIAITCGLVACSRVEGTNASTSAASTAHAASRSGVAGDNPFTRPSTEDESPACITITLNARDSAYTATIANRCDASVAVLTAPVETRLRLTGKEKFVNERMRWAAYALLYVVKADLGKGAFVGDGVVRDGGLRVRQPPAYVSVPAKSMVVVPLRCAIEAPPGRYAMSLATYEAPLGDAVAENGAFDCSLDVVRYNDGHEKSGHVTIGGDVREVQSTTIVVHLP